jgi:hypothetical protein
MRESFLSETPAVFRSKRVRALFSASYQNHTFRFFGSHFEKTSLSRKSDQPSGFSDAANTEQAPLKFF